jgi:hypothetical protein
MMAIPRCPKPAATTVDEAVILRKANEIAQERRQQG